MTVQNLGVSRFVNHSLKLLLLVILMSSAVFAEKYALLVGINDYSTVRPLRGSLNDITQINQVLLNDLGFAEENIRVLTDQEATKSNILSALDSLASQTKAGDALLWYYSDNTSSKKTTKCQEQKGN